MVFDGYLLPTFYITEQSHSGGVSHIVCHDLCKNLDIPFDYSGYRQFRQETDKEGKPVYDTDGNPVYDQSKPIWYATSQIIGNIASQCGFSASSPAVSRMPKLCYNDFAEKSCRQILIDVSKAEVGHWVCSSDSGLSFVPFSHSSSGFEIAENDRTEIELHGCKTISGIAAEDEISGEIFTSGSAWKNTERVSGRYLNAEIAGQITAQITGYEYRGWSCSNAVVSTLFNIGDFIAYNGNALPVLNISCSFTALGIVAQMSAPAADSSFSEYEDLYSRKIKGCAAYDRLLGCVSVTRQGIMIGGS